MDNEMLRSVIELDKNIKKLKPVVECLTNRVTINDCANMLLAMGASPIMAEIESEMEDIMSVSSSLVLNLGLLDPEYVSAMKTAAKAARAQGKPIVLDPVGAGASRLRDRLDPEMIELVHPDIIRGNMSEIRSLSGAKISSRGVDASSDDAVNDDNIDELCGIVKNYAAATKAVVCATGAVDIVSDGTEVYCLRNGSSMLCDVTGTGCMCTAMTGAAAAAGDPLTAAITAVSILSISGEYAAEHCREIGAGIGTFRVKLFDYVYNLCDEDFIRSANIVKM